MQGRFGERGGPGLAEVVDGVGVGKQNLHGIGHAEEQFVADGLAPEGVARQAEACAERRRREEHGREQDRQHAEDKDEHTPCTRSLSPPLLCPPP